MIVIRRAATAAALLALASATRLDAQSNRVRFTLTGGAQAGTYELTAAAMCDVKDVRGKPPAISGHFFDEAKRYKQKGPGATSLEGFHLYTLKEMSDKPDVVSFGAHFKSSGGSRKTINYEVYTIPPKLQEPGLEMDRHGEGTVTVRRTDTGAIATFRGKTKDGVGIEGSLECGG